MMKFFGFMLFIVLFYGCNLGVNTVDPQLSENSAVSRKGKVFINKYSVVQKPYQFFNIKEVWSEYVWKKAIENGQITKSILTDKQLVFNVDDDSSKLKLEQFNTDWKVDFASPIISYALQKNVYGIRFNSTKIPDSTMLNIMLMKNGEWVKSGQIYFYIK